MTTRTNEEIMDSTPESEGWDSVVSEAERHVDERGAAEQAAVERQRPASDVPKIVAFALVLAVIAVWDVRAWTRAPEPLPPAQEQMHMSWVVADVVEALEDFRVEEGRLPSAEEFAEFAEDDVAYQISGESYELNASGVWGSLSYDGSIPVHEWAAIQGATVRAEEDAS